MKEKEKARKAKYYCLSDKGIRVASLISEMEKILEEK